MPARFTIGPRLPSSVRVTSTFHKNALIKTKAVERLISARRTDTCLTPEPLSGHFEGVLRLKTSANPPVCSFGARTGPKPVFTDGLENTLAAPEQEAVKSKMEDSEEKKMT